MDIPKEIWLKIQDYAIDKLKKKNEIANRIKTHLDIGRNSSNLQHARDMCTSVIILDGITGYYYYSELNNSRLYIVLDNTSGDIIFRFYY